MAADIGHRLHAEITEAQALLGNMRDILGDDEELASNTVEGETDLNELIERATVRCLELDGLLDGLSTIEGNLAKRKERLTKQRMRLRELIAVGMETAGHKRLELAIASVTLKVTAPKVEVISESDIPPKFWTPQEPKLNKTELAKALKDGPVAGATLSNGGMTVQIKGT